MLHQCFGVQQIGETFHHPHLNLEMIPIHGRVDEILERHGHLIGSESPARGESEQAPMGFRGRYHFLEQALSRNLGILTAGEQERLLNARVAPVRSYIPG